MNKIIWSNRRTYINGFIAFIVVMFSVFLTKNFDINPLLAIGGPFLLFTVLLFANAFSATVRCSNCKTEFVKKYERYFSKHKVPMPNCPNCGVAFDEQ